eukprot:scaffold14606_cov23-Tisochrysis_lutea.AAC.1
MDSRPCWVCNRQCPAGFGYPLPCAFPLQQWHMRMQMATGVCVAKGPRGIWVSTPLCIPLTVVAHAHANGKVAVLPIGTDLYFLCNSICLPNFVVNLDKVWLGPYGCFASHPFPTYAFSNDYRI